MSDEHKRALEKGRAEGRAVRDYLEALRSTKPKRGRKRTPESIAKRLEKIEQELATASAIDELKLVQERRDLTAELEAMRDTVDVDALEEAFTKVAKAYGERKGISYGAWREVGVPASVLARAGISRSGG
jgi:ribosomal protein L17